MLVLVLVDVLYAPDKFQFIKLESYQRHRLMVYFGKDFAPLTTGRLGFAARISPNHFHDPLNRPCNSPMKWITGGN